MVRKDTIPAAAAFSYPAAASSSQAAAAAAGLGAGDATASRQAGMISPIAVEFVGYRTMKHWLMKSQDSERWNRNQSVNHWMQSYSRITQSLSWLI